MWGVTRRAPMTRAVTIPEYDRPLVTALVIAKSPRLAFGRAAVHPHHGMGAVAKVIVGNSSDDLEWLEAATTALGAQVIYLPIRRSDNRTAERERQLAMADAMRRAGLFGGGGPRTPGRSRVECPIGVDPNHTSGGHAASALTVVSGARVKLGYQRWKSSASWSLRTRARI